jgi:transcription elongation factor GreA-like protein
MKTIYICEIPHQLKPDIYDIDLNKLIDLCVYKTQDSDEEFKYDLNDCISILCRENSSVIYSDNELDFLEQLQGYADSRSHQSYSVWRAMNEYFDLNKKDINDEE